MSCGKSATFQSIFLVIGSDRSNRRLKVRWRDEKKAWKGYALGLDSHISVNPCDKFFESASRSGKRDASGANLKGGVYALRYIFHSIVVISGSDRPNRREKLWRGGYARHLESIPQSTPAINSSDRLDRWVVRKMLQSGCVCNLDVYNLSQFFSYWLRRKSEMSDRKEAPKGTHVTQIS